MKAGYLRKKGAKRRNWTRRWFVLRGSVLSYYKAETSEQPKGTIKLEMAVVATSQRKPFCFFVRTPQRILMMWPESRDERDGWIEAIKCGVMIQYSGADHSDGGESGGSDLSLSSSSDTLPTTGLMKYESLLASRSAPSITPPTLSLLSTKSLTLARLKPGVSISPPTSTTSLITPTHTDLQNNRPIMQPLRQDCEGMLLKKGQKRRNWTKRWFALRDGIMLYYHNEKKKQIKGEVKILKTTIVDKLPTKSFGFYIENTDKKMLLRAKDEIEQQTWIEAIQLAIRVSQLTS